MTGRLLIDAGNSRLKWGWGRGGQLTSMEWIENQRIDTELRQRWGQLPAPDQIWLANSAGAGREAQIRQIAAELWGLPLQTVRSASHFGALTNGYRRADQLGVDRWLGMVAAWQRLQRPFCLIDCGTAVTIDCVDHSGAHLGGMIFPGIGVSWKEFETKVAHLEHDHGKSMQHLPARSTREGLQVGVDGSVANVERAITSILQHHGELLLLTTGGGAAELEQGARYPFQRVENAVLEGLLLEAHAKRDGA